MIKTVTIKNYILIDDITLELNKGFNVITGETGAGKSIIISAIDAALGAKVNKEVIKTGTDRAFIELVIEVDENFDNSMFEANGIDLNGKEIIISKEITPSYNRSRINGVMVVQEFIKEIREKLLDIHTQHQSYNYVQQKNHLTLLDNFALKPHRDNVLTFKEKYNKLISLRKKLDDMNNRINSAKEKEDFLKFQIKEIEDCSIEDVNECEKLEKELDILSNIEKLKELSYSSYWSLNGEDGSILNALSSVKTNISKLTSMDENTAEIEESFINAYETLKDIASQMRDYSESKENDNERMEYINERLSLLDKIKRKYGNTLEEVLKTYENLSNELNSFETVQEDIETTEKEIKLLEGELKNLSNIISNVRKELSVVLSEAVEKKLSALELPKSKFKISVEPAEMTETGEDRAEFLISANISEDVKPLSKIASGGEISRVMLSLKSIFAQADKTNTVIFDEIDTGVSGKASQAVADCICELSKSHQIILITHQPIIAAKADSHFYVKKEQSDVTKVKVFDLKDENRVKAIALLSAGEINDESEAFAKNLLGV